MPRKARSGTTWQGVRAVNDLSHGRLPHVPRYPQVSPPNLLLETESSPLSFNATNRRWLTSSLVVVLAYATPLGWWLWQPKPPSISTPPPAAMVVELAPQATSPSKPNELPPGPESQPSQPSQANTPRQALQPDKPQESPAEPPQQPTPEKPAPAKPSPTAPPAPEPEAVLPESVPEPAPVESPEPERPAEIDTNPKPRPGSQQNPSTTTEPQVRHMPEPVERTPTYESPAAAAATASAPEEVKQKEETAAAPRQGVNVPVADLNKVPSWRDLLLHRLNAAKRYPSHARRLRQEGVSYLHFRMDTRGQVLASRIARSSGYELLDQETLALIQRAEPLPLPPPELAGHRLEFVVPVDFFLRQ